MRKHILTAIFTGLCLTAAGGSALAAPDKSQDTRFSKMDRNSDGKLTLDEFKGRNSKNADKKSQRFKKLDADSDGSVTLAEFKATGKKPNK